MPIPCLLQNMLARRRAIGCNHVAVCAELDQLQAHVDEQQRTISELRYNNSMLTALNTALGIECQQLRSVSCAAAYAQAANAMHLRILLPCASCLLSLQNVPFADCFWSD